ncbi:MAG: ATP-binding cassette domain-containing protein [Bacilli bacterium]|nr:ATP-binding cassette domain-containing protein [Bacilli bacterium]
MNSLSIKKLSVAFQKGTPSEKKVLDEVNLELEKDDFVCILGSNGTGKSTLLKAILGLVPYTGSISLNEKPIDNEKPYKRARKIGVVYQDPLTGTSPNLTVGENLLLASRKKSFLNKKANRAFLNKAKEDLSSYGLGIEERMRTPTGLLSGGMRQVLTLYMASTFDSELLLLDEHTAALDPNAATKVMDITENILVQKKHIPTLMVTHNLDFALRYGNRLIVLNKGKIVLDVKNEEKKSLTREALLESYGAILSDKTLLRE